MHKLQNNCSTQSCKQSAPHHITKANEREKIEYELPDGQAGFRRGRTTADVLVALQVLIENTIEMDGQAFVVFIDYSKAFDIISQVQMFEIISEMGFPKHIVALLEALYNDQSAVIRWNGQHSSAFKIERGVRQCCIISPHLSICTLSR